MLLRKKVNIKSVYTDYVSILNGLLRLPKRAAGVLSFLLELNAMTDEQPLLIDKKVRLLIRNVLSLSESNLSHLLGQLRERDLLVREGKKLYLSKSIIPVEVDGHIDINFTLDIDAD